MKDSFEQQARTLLDATLRTTRLAFAPADRDRLAGELARFLEEGYAMGDAVPTHVEPQTVALFSGTEDAA